MRARLRSWWQQIKQRRVAIIVTIASIAVAIALIIIGYWFDVTGFNGYTQVSTIRTLSGPMAGTITRTEVYQSGKTLWDWLQLLIVPLVLAIIALVFQRANSRTERQIAKDRYDQDREIAKQRYEQDQQIAKQRYEQDQQIALDKQHQDLLQVYLDRMSELLLEKDLRTNPSEEVKNVARARTITVLTQLNARRIGYVFAFLREAGLMSTTYDSSVVSLRNADLRAVKWGDANLSEANLGGANLSDANLRSANLNEAFLSEAYLYKANLSGTYLSGAYLSGADLGEATLRIAYLSEADLTGANLSNANLSKANLDGANLISANLSKANLSTADLSNAVVTEEQLKKASSLTGATLPDGSIHP